MYIMFPSDDAFQAEIVVSVLNNETGQPVNPTFRWAWTKYSSAEFIATQIRRRIVIELAKTPRPDV
jgi:hypothetical protein